MSSKKSLQKLTEIPEKVNEVLLLKRIEPTDLEQLSEVEKDSLYSILNHKLNNLKGDERDTFLKKFDAIIPQSTKNQLWEYNHNKVTTAITLIMQDCGAMPSVSQIAEKAGLSRQTVSKHIKDFKTNPQYLEYAEQFKFMGTKLLAKLFQFALAGDLGAAKLYFNVIGALSSEQANNSTLIQNQSNYIQINNTVISQETVKQLNPEQLNSLETIFRTALPQPKPLQVGISESNTEG
jgi:DNA-binding phage protein